jgi:hypothetical protein
VVFSFGDTQESLLAITITFTALGFAVGFIYRGRIYKSLSANILEGSLYLNLVSLSTLVLAKVPHQIPLIYFLVGTVLVITVGVIVCQFSDLYFIKSTAFLKIKSGLRNLRVPQRAKADDPQIITTSSQNPNKIVSKTVVDLREPLLEM